MALYLLYGIVSITRRFKLTELLVFFALHILMSCRRVVVLNVLHFGKKPFTFMNFLDVSLFCEYIRGFINLSSTQNTQVDREISVNSS